MMVQAFVGMGSNLGDREMQCQAAMDRLALLPATSLSRVSPFFDTPPQEGVGGGPFLNAVAEIATTLPPRLLLDHLRGIEADLGRAVDHPPGSARTMDLDILLYDDLVLHEPGLTIPHPRMAGRWFVLAPLAAIAPTLRHPVLGATMTELLRRLSPDGSAVPLGARS